MREGDPEFMSRSIVIIPTYNERDNVCPLIQRIAALREDLDMLFIDDASPDRTGELLEDLRKAYPQLRVIHRPGKLGLGSAYRQAFKYALKDTYKRLITMDADFSHQPKFLPDLIRASSTADLVIGSRYVKGGGSHNWPLSRRVLSRSANTVARRLLQLQPRDVTSGFRCFGRFLAEALNRADIRTSGYSFLVEITFYAQQLGFKIEEIPIMFEDCTLAKSKMNRSEIFKAMGTLAKLFFFRLSGKCGNRANVIR